MILILFVAIVLINFYIKKDLYTSTIIGLVLVNIYLITNYNVIFIDVFSKTNIKIFFSALIFIVFLYIVKRINDLTSFTNLKLDIQNIFNNLLKEKKQKIFTVMLLSFLFLKLPIIGMLYLILISVFFRISKYNMILIPIIMINYIRVAKFMMMYDLENAYENMINFLIFFYVLYIIFILIERVRKKEEFKINYFILDVAYIIIAMIINIYIYIILFNLYNVQISVIMSLIITYIISNIVYNKFDIIIYKEIKEISKHDIKQSSVLKNLKLPYLTLFILLVLEFLGYHLAVQNLFVGCMYTIGLNFIILKKYNQNIISIDKILIFKILVIMLLVLLSMYVFNNIGLFENINGKISEIIDTIYYTQVFTLVPQINYVDKIFVQVSNLNIYDMKILAIIEIQSMFSFVTLLIIQYVFSLKKEEMVHILTLLILSSIFFQIVIYIY